MRRSWGSLAEMMAWEYCFTNSALGANIRTEANSRPVRVTYDWLAELFSTRNPWFGPELAAGIFPSISGTILKYYTGTPYSNERDLG